MRGELLDSLKRRIARFHLIDNTRGEPDMWDDADIRKLDLRLDHGKLTGTVDLENKSGDRGYHAELLGFVESDKGRVVRLDMVAKGLYWGDSPFTRGDPKENFHWLWRFHWRAATKRQTACRRKDRKAGCRDTLNKSPK